MFTDMGLPLDAAALDRAFRAWLAETMPAGMYRAWLVEADGGGIVGGGGITILPWPPGPQLHAATGSPSSTTSTPSPRIARRGLARLIMDAIHAWCRRRRDRVGRPQRQPEGLPLYESMGYHATASPMMFLALSRSRSAGGFRPMDPPLPSWTGVNCRFR